MSDDWQVGDLALCVVGGRGRKMIARVGDHFYLENGDRTARIIRGSVREVKYVGLLIGPDKQLAIGFSDQTPWLASRFRKIRPLTDEERDSFVADLRESTRIPVQDLREMKATYCIEENGCGQ
jgi:hypothetical protein